MAATVDKVESTIRRLKNTATPKWGSRLKYLETKLLEVAIGYPPRYDYIPHCETIFWLVPAVEIDHPLELLNVLPVK